METLLVCGLWTRWCAVFRRTPPLGGVYPLPLALLIVNDWVWACHCVAGCLGHHRGHWGCGVSSLLCPACLMTSCCFHRSPLSPVPCLWWPCLQIHVRLMAHESGIQGSPCFSLFMIPAGLHLIGTHCFPPSSNSFPLVPALRQLMSRLVC